MNAEKMIPLDIIDNEKVILLIRNKFKYLKCAKVTYNVTHQHDNN